MGFAPILRPHFTRRAKGAEMKGRKGRTRIVALRSPWPLNSARVRRMLAAYVERPVELPQDPGAGDVRASLNLPAAALELVSGHLGCSDSASIRRLAVHYARLPLPAPAPRKAKGKGKVSGPTLDEVLKPIREEIARLKAQNVTKPVPQTEEGYVIGPQGRPVLKRLAASSAEASRIVVQRLQGQFSRKRTTDYFVAGS